MHMDLLYIRMLAQRLHQDAPDIWAPMLMLQLNARLQLDLLDTSSFQLDVGAYWKESADVLS